MAQWFIKPRYTIAKPKGKASGSLPQDTQTQWVKCPQCGAIIYHKDLEANAKVCATCGHHFRIDPPERIALITEPDSFEEFGHDIISDDPLQFIDASGSYSEKLERAREKTGANEGVITGFAMIGAHRISLSVMDFRFLGGSMGSAVGEKIYQAIMAAHDNNIPCIIVSCSGGARMHEGILSLMQMAKTSAALARLNEKGLPYISVITDPTTGGVTASFAMLGDVNIAEPGAMIGFAGARVIEQTIRQKLPEGFQRAEFLEDHGFLDCIVDRRELKETLLKMLDFFSR